MAIGRPRPGTTYTGNQPRNQFGGEAANPAIQEAANAQTAFEQSAGASIPGLSDALRGAMGGALSQHMHNTMTSADWRGLLPNSSAPQMGPVGSPFTPAGPYGQQAMMMAGLLGRRQIPQQPGQAQSQGLLPTKHGPRMMYGK